MPAINNPSANKSNNVSALRCIRSFAVLRYRYDYFFVVIFKSRRRKFCAGGGNMKPVLSVPENAHDIYAKHPMNKIIRKFSISFVKHYFDQWETVSSKHV